MTALRWIAFGVGLGVVLATFGSLLRTLVIPRGVTSRLSVLIARAVTRGVILAIAKRFREYESKDRVLALGAPITLLANFVAWLFLFLLGYALMLWPLIGASFGEALRESGSSMLTLGFAATNVPAANVIHFVAGTTGLVVIALEIAYLPVLYGSFNRRETLVTMLQSRAGAPAWGPEILARHQLVNIVDNLKALYGDWEQWSADVTETHATYPVLVWFRSPEPLRSWIVALLAVLDSAAMFQALSPRAAPSESRLCLRMGFICLRDIATTLEMSFDPDPFPDDPLDLTFDEFLGGVHRLEQAGFPMERSAEEAWPHFKGWRVNYESIAYALADAVVAPPGPWSGPRSDLPGYNIVPQRPVDRRPGERHQEVAPKGHRGY